MNSFFAFLLVLAVFQASAEPDPNSSLQSNGFNNLKGIKSCFEPLPMLNTHIQTAVVENPTVTFPSCIPPSGISESCHCMRTLVRPQIRNEIITVPAIDRIVRTVSTPVVETIDCGGGSRLVTFTQGNNIMSGGSGSQTMSDGMQNSGRRNNVFLSEGNSEKSFASGQNNNGITSGMSGINVGLVARPSIITFQTCEGGNSQGFSNSGKPMGSKIHLIVK